MKICPISGEARATGGDMSSLWGMYMMGSFVSMVSIATAPRTPPTVSLEGHTTFGNLAPFSSNHFKNNSSTLQIYIGRKMMKNTKSNIASLNNGFKLRWRKMQRLEGKIQNIIMV